jgi:hypothetical protein
VARERVKKEKEIDDVIRSIKVKRMIRCEDNLFLRLMVGKTIDINDDGFLNSSIYGPGKVT